MLLIQKSILRDAVTDLSLHYLARPPRLSLLLRSRPLARRQPAAALRTCVVHLGASSHAVGLSVPSRRPNTPVGWTCAHPWLPQAKAKIMVVRDIERDEIEYISKTLGCLPVAHPDHMRPEKLGSADLVEEILVRAGKGWEGGCGAAW